MRKDKDESYEEWVSRVKMYEQGIAMQKLARGEDPDKVLEEMSKRIVDKALHPVYLAIRESFITDYDSEKSRKEYEEKFLKDHIPVADHVGEDFFDNSKNI